LPPGLTMHRLGLWIQGVPVPARGAPGLFRVGVIEFAVLNLPDVKHLLAVTAAGAHPRKSVRDRTERPAVLDGRRAGAGDSGQRGRERRRVRRFGEERVAQTREAFRKWDVLALAVPAVLPPPMPFKVFVLSSGVFGFPFRRLVITLLIARGLRYVFWAAMGAA